MRVYLHGFVCTLCLCAWTNRCLWAAVWMPEFSAKTASAHPLNQLSSPLASILRNDDRFLRSNPTRKRRLKLSECWAAWKWPGQVWADRWRVTVIVVRAGHQSQGPNSFLSFLNWNNLFSACMHMCMCHTMHVEVKGQLGEIHSLHPLYRSWESNPDRSSGLVTSTEPSHWLLSTSCDKSC